MRPYARMVLLHVTLIVGGFATQALGAPIGALAFLVVLKIVADLRLHHRANTARLGESPGPAQNQA